jgi:uncharacterized protein (DUF2336 family)
MVTCKGAAMTMGFSLSGLEDVAAGEESPRRDAILSALTNQYVELEPRLSDRHIELYDNVFRVLVKGIELQARLALSEKLGPMKRAPREIIRDLANDPYAIVAGPVLQHSPVLDEVDLVDVARNQSEAHRAAIAQRNDINTVVTDVLVGRREQSVLVALVGNGTAHLSNEGAATLADVAVANEVVAQALAARLALPATAVTQLLSAARAVVVNTLVHAEPEARARDISEAVGEAVNVVKSLPQDTGGDITDQQIVALYGMDAFDEVALALSSRCGIREATVLRAIHARSADGLMIVMKAANMGRSYVEAMLSIKLKAQIGDYGLKELLGQYDRVNASEPERMLGFVLQSHAHAIVH